MVFQALFAGRASTVSFFLWEARLGENLTKFEAKKRTRPPPRLRFSRRAWRRLTCRSATNRHDRPRWKRDGNPHIDCANQNSHRFCCHLNRSSPLDRSCSEGDVKIRAQECRYTCVPTIVPTESHLSDSRFASGVKPLDFSLASPIRMPMHVLSMFPILGNRSSNMLDRLWRGHQILRCRQAHTETYQPAFDQPAKETIRKRVHTRAKLTRAA